MQRFQNEEITVNNIWISSEEGGCEVPDYYKGKLMMEYLINIRHLSYDQILKHTPSESTIYQEMIKWNNEGGMKKEIKKIN
jgi:hypothetical protein